MRHTWTLSIALAACTGEPVEPVGPPPGELLWERTLAVGARAKNELDCQERVSGWGCYAAHLPGDDVPLPARTTELLGLSGLIRSSRTLPDGLTETLSFQRLTLGPDGLWQSTIRPVDEPWYRLVVGSVVAVLRGEEPEVQVPPDFQAWLDSTPMTTDPLTRDEHGWFIDGVHDRRLVHIAAHDGRPAAWLSLEVLHGGAILSVFPDVPYVPLTAEAAAEALAPDPSQGPPPGGPPPGEAPVQEGPPPEAAP